MINNELKGKTVCYFLAYADIRLTSAESD